MHFDFDLNTILSLIITVLIAPGVMKLVTLNTRVEVVLSQIRSILDWEKTHVEEEIRRNEEMRKELSELRSLLMARFHGRD